MWRVTCGVVVCGVAGALLGVTVVGLIALYAPEGILDW